MRKPSTIKTGLLAVLKRKPEKRKGIAGFEGVDGGDTFEDRLLIDLSVDLREREISGQVVHGDRGGAGDRTDASGERGALEPDTISINGEGTAGQRRCSVD